MSLLKVKCIALHRQTLGQLTLFMLLCGPQHDDNGQNLSRIKHLQPKYQK